MRPESLGVRLFMVDLLPESPDQAPVLPVIFSHTDTDQPAAMVCSRTGSSHENGW
jgi:hypothetical protein